MLTVFAAVAVIVLLAELGDKTRIMHMTMAADPGIAVDTFRRVVGMLAVDGAAVTLGSVVGSRLPARTVRRVSAAVFVIFGILAPASLLLGGE